MCPSPIYGEIDEKVLLFPPNVLTYLEFLSYLHPNIRVFGS